jgi:phytanoyl-CoA hydroxylase
MMNTMRDLLGDSFVKIDNDGFLKHPQQKAHTSWHRDTRAHKIRNEQLPQVDEPKKMPGHVRMKVKAGTAIAFHGSTYQSALHNYSDDTRISIIYNYAPMFLRTWMGYEPSETLKSKATTNLRQMLPGMLPWIRDPKAFEEQNVNRWVSFALAIGNRSCGIPILYNQNKTIKGELVNERTVAATSGFFLA